MTDQNFEEPMLIVQYDSVPAQQDLAWLVQRRTQVAQRDGVHWFRLPVPLERAEFAVLSGVCWRLVGGESLCGFEDSVPTKSLPRRLDWQDMSRAIQWQMPVAQFSDRQPIRVNSVATLELVRGGEFVTPVGILVDAESLLAWVDDAAEVRMRGLKFVARGDFAIVIGQPLPHLNGRLLTRHDQLLLPAGMTLEPSLPASTVSELLVQSEGLPGENASDALFLGAPAHWLNQVDREIKDGETTDREISTCDVAKSEVRNTGSDMDERSSHSECHWSTITPQDWVAVSRQAIRSWQC